MRASPWVHLAVTGLLAAGCGHENEPVKVPEVLLCNGHAELCDRRYDQVAYPGTHDSYSDTDERFLAPDQTHPIAQQLADGIRVLHFEVHVYNGGVIDVCHGLCELGRKPFADEMAAVANFLKANPHEVVTLLLERSDGVVTADDLGDAMAAAGLEPFLRVQAEGQPWPTLKEMIQDGHRLVALLDDPSGGHHDGLLPRWAWTWETPWDNKVPADFARCGADRGTAGNSLYVVDTYMEDLPIQDAQHALLVNYDPFLIDRVLSCQQGQAALPNFVMVNFYEVSDLFHVVDVLNGFEAAPADLAGFPPAGFQDGGGLDGLPDGGLLLPDAGPI